jgi:Mg2+-importing ATPase
MLPTQVLLNNFLYDLSQLTIPTDRVDPMYFQGPQRWDVGIIRRFMLGAGPVSSLFDFLTFFILLVLLHATTSGFRTAWFVESLLTQTLVLLIIRTTGAPWRSWPSAPVATTVILVAAVGIILPYSPFAKELEFQRLPFTWLLWLFGISAAYLACIELVKRFIVKVTLKQRIDGLAIRS